MFTWVTVSQHLLECFLFTLTCKSRSESTEYSQTGSEKRISYSICTKLTTKVYVLHRLRRVHSSENSCNLERVWGHANLTIWQQWKESCSKTLCTDSTSLNIKMFVTRTLKRLEMKWVKSTLIWWCVVI